MPFSTFLIAPLFFSVPFGLTRPRGQRWLAGIGLYGMYLVMMTLLFGGLALENALILSILYGRHAVISGEIHIVGGRRFVELSNGDKYTGPANVLWFAADFVVLCILGVTALTIGQAVHARSATVRRVVSRFSQALNSK